MASEPGFGLGGVREEAEGIPDSDKWWVGLSSTGSLAAMKKPQKHSRPCSLTTPTPPQHKVLYTKCRIYADFAFSSSQRTSQRKRSQKRTHLLQWISTRVIKTEEILKIGELLLLRGELRHSVGGAWELPSPAQCSEGLPCIPHTFGIIQIGG